MTMELFILIMKIVVCIAIVLVLGFFTLSLLSAITNYFTAKRTLLMAQTQEEINKQNDPLHNVSLGERIDYTIDLLNLCNTLIDVEINDIIRSHQRLNQKYESRNLDKDTKSVANKVFVAIRPEILQSDELVINTEYILQHIMDETVLRLMQATYTFNTTLQIM